MSYHVMEFHILCHDYHGIPSLYFVIKVDTHHYTFDTFDTKYRAGNFTNTDSNGYMVYTYHHLLPYKDMDKTLSANLSVLILYGFLATTKPKT